MLKIGDVLVWNLREQNSLSPVQVHTHGDTVTSMKWIAKSVNDVYLLVSASRDGYIAMNKLTVNFSSSTLYKR